MGFIIENRTQQEVSNLDFNKFCKCCSRKLGLPNGWEVGLFFVSNKEIKSLNKKTRRIDKATDVLSFPLQETRKLVASPNGKIMLGDIVIAPTIAKEHAQKNGLSEIEQIKILIVHGFLHLLGYDHVEDEDYEIMDKKEKIIINCF